MFSNFVACSLEASNTAVARAVSVFRVKRLLGFACVVDLGRDFYSHHMCVP